jgi:hypothetical protein
VLSKSLFCEEKIEYRVKIVILQEGDLGDAGFSKKKSTRSSTRGATSVANQKNICRGDVLKICCHEVRGL